MLTIYLHLCNLGVINDRVTNNSWVTLIQTVEPDHDYNCY